MLNLQLELGIEGIIDCDSPLLEPGHLKRIKHQRGRRDFKNRHLTPDLEFYFTPRFRLKTLKSKNIIAYSLHLKPLPLQ